MTLQLSNDQMHILTWLYGFHIHFDEIFMVSLLSPSRKAQSGGDILCSAQFSTLTYPIMVTQSLYFVIAINLSVCRGNLELGERKIRPLSLLLLLYFEAFS